MDQVTPIQLRNDTSKVWIATYALRQNKRERPYGILSPGFDCALRHAFRREDGEDVQAS